VLWLNIQYLHKEFVNPLPSCSKFNPHAYSSAVSRTRPANAGTRNPRGLTRPAQDSNSVLLCY